MGRRSNPTHERSDPALGPGLRHRRTIEVTWGDCDASGIVFYPRYYAWFDACTHAMLDRVGLDHRRLRLEHDIIGCGLVQASARFRSPATYGDELTAYSQVAKISTRSFTVVHEFCVGSRVVVEGEEVRVWARASTEGGAKLRTVEIPGEVQALLAQVLT